MPMARAHEACGGGWAACRSHGVDVRGVSRDSSLSCSLSPTSITKVAERVVDALLLTTIGLEFMRPRAARAWQEDPRVRPELGERSRSDRT